MTRRVMGTALFAGLLAFPGEPAIPSQPCHVIPFEFTENTVWLQVKVNGKGPFPFLLDTAAANFGIAWDTAERAGFEVLEVLQDGPAGSGDGPVRLGIVRDATVEVGPVRLTLPYIAAVPLDSPRQVWDHPFDGVIGFPLFNHYVVAVDYAAKELRLYDPESFEYTGNGYIWPVRLDDKNPFVKASFLFPGRRSVQGDFLVDSGMRVIGLFSAPYAAEHGLEQAMRSARRRLVSVPTTGVQGESGRWIGRIDSLSFGPFSLKQPVIGISTAKGGFFAQPRIAGAIGTELLRRFTVIFDYDRGRLILEPNAALNEAAREDASGMALRNEGEPRRVAVWRVAPESPASEAGIQPGDRIVAVAGQENPTLWPARQALMAEGETVNVAVERAGKRIDYALQLRKLL